MTDLHSAAVLFEVQRSWPGYLGQRVAWSHAPGRSRRPSRLAARLRAFVRPRPVAAPAPAPEASPSRA